MDDIDKMMQNLKGPEIQAAEHQQQFRLTILNTKRSALAGIGLLVLPVLFFAGVIFKHYLRIDLGIITGTYEWIAQLDATYGDLSILNWIIRILLLFGPVIAIFINLAAILHISYQKGTKRIGLLCESQMAQFNHTVCLYADILHFLSLSDHRKCRACCLTLEVASG